MKTSERDAQKANSLMEAPKDIINEMLLDKAEELADIDSLWYFIVKNGNWILGSG